ncbi:hypothetical protein Z946_2274 [Sulfitobacter noctilucicola]|uniref:CsgH-like domain-containing protein n=1 Tax=Sulfitobacter noctilucicola TaxID=1342301 RepID=A0A7W6M9S7_9RHOB|nr:curli-like amyloid fiber formation chaperone CsgH [Sulfitobacter noctilucicola]KIN63403.1 hypothetical protein Z946_2274 [Sulfitobacter noctilucicola]MBB4175080.1 hypothetical protein [Sulfitobacter noctilucicola]
MKLISAVFSLVFPIALSASADEADKAWLELKNENGSVQVQAFAEIAVPENGSYELVATKKGKSGSSVSKQAGTISGASDQPLSVSRFSVEEGAMLEVILKVTNAAGEVFEAKELFVGE